MARFQNGQSPKENVLPIYNQLLSAYIIENFAAEDTALVQAREESPKHGLPAISIQPEEGRFLQMLVAASQAKIAVEIGTLGGYSGIWLARGLPPGGKLFTLEKSSKHAGVAQAHFEAAGVHEKVEIVVGDAHDALLKIAAKGPLDFVFIDAEKAGYSAYFAWAMAHTRVGGIIAAHNAFRGGRIEEAPTDDDPADMAAFNRQVAGDSRVISTIFPAGDGTLVAVKIRSGA